MNYAERSIFSLDKASLGKLPAEELPLSSYYEIGDFLSTKDNEEKVKTQIPQLTM